MGTLRLLIADDQAITRGGLRALLATDPRMEAIGEAVDGGTPSRWPPRSSPTSS